MDDEKIAPTNIDSDPVESEDAELSTPDLEGVVGGGRGSGRSDTVRYNNNSSGTNYGDEDRDL